MLAAFQCVWACMVVGGIVMNFHRAGPCTCGIMYSTAMATAEWAQRMVLLPSADDAG